MTQLFDAHRQWRDRPVDERYWNLRELHDAVQARRTASVASRITPRDLKFGAQMIGDGKEAHPELVILGEKSTAVPSHWAFSQACELLDAPAGWLRRLPPELASNNLNWAAQNAKRDAMMMLWANGSNPGITRCFATPSYTRLWDSEVVSWVRNLTQDESNGWHRPPAMTDDKYPSGLYAGDRNVFIFMCNESTPLIDDTGSEMYRGFFCWNSEVRQMSFGLSMFLYQRICGNHIVWGAEQLFNIRMPHIGDRMTARAQDEINRMLGAYLNAPASGEQAIIDRAIQYEVGKTREDAFDWLINRKRGFTQAEAKAVIDGAVERGKDPTRLWTLVDSATRLSQSKGHADERTAADRKAGKLLEVVF